MRDVIDPLSELFIVRREAIDPDSLRPSRLNIPREIVVRFPHLNATEIPLRKLVLHGTKPHSPGTDRWRLTAEGGLPQ